MTEAEWLACADPAVMLDFLRGNVSARKRRLFAIACGRRIHHLLNDDRYRQAVQVVAEMPDSEAEPVSRLRAFFQRIELPPPGTMDRDFLGEAAVTSPLSAASRLSMFKGDLFQFATAAARSAVAPNACRREDDWRFLANDPGWRSAYAQERRAQALLLREVIGNPFHRISPETALLTDSVCSIAGATYADRAFDLLPILADALEDAGCTNRDILDHCRQPGEHVRGCWVVDLVLGKK